MKGSVITAICIALIASACSYKEQTTVKPAPAPPANTVLTTPAPAGSTVVYTPPTTPATTTVYTTR